MGPKFVIVFLGVEAKSLSDFINEIKESTEKLQISLSDNFQIEEIDSEKPKKKRKKK